MFEWREPERSHVRAQEEEVSRNCSGDRRISSKYLGGTNQILQFILICYISQSIVIIFARRQKWGVNTTGRLCSVFLMTRVLLCFVVIDRMNQSTDFGSGWSTLGRKWGGEGLLINQSTNHFFLVETSVNNFEDPGELFCELTCSASGLFF